MFCRFCGKSIQDDSDFCSYCGKSQSTKSKVSRPRKTPKYEQIDIYTLEIIASVCFYVGIIGFLILYMKMAPGIGGDKFIAYLYGAAITIATAVIVHKIRNKDYTKKRQMIALIFGLMLLVPSLTFRIVYECKVDAAIASIPKSGTVAIEVRTKADYYSYFIPGTVRNPYSKVQLNGHGGNAFYVELNKPYSAKISAGYEGQTGIASSSASGSTTKTVKFTQENLENLYTIKEEVSLQNGHALVTVTFKRICPFWEVIFFQPS